MPEQSVKPSSHTSPEIIDLTLGSDDEDDPRTRSKIKARKPILPPAIDGLPRSFDTTRRNPNPAPVARDIDQRRIYPAILPPGSAPRTPIPLPTHRQSLPGADQRPTSSTRPIQKRSSTAILPNTGQPVKRQKIQGGTATQGGLRASTHSPSMVMHQKQQNNPLVVYPAGNTSNKSGSLTQTYQPTPIRPPQTSNTRSRISGGSEPRRQSQGIPPGVKRSNETPIDVKAVADRVGAFITIYISPLMRQALEKTRSKLEAKHGQYVAKRITSKLGDDSRSIVKSLIEDASFFAEHQANNWQSLSPAYEKRLLAQACKALDERAVDFVKEVLQNLPKNHTNNNQLQAPFTRRSKRGDNSGSDMSTRSNDTKSNDSSEEDSDITMEYRSTPNVRTVIPDVQIARNPQRSTSNWSIHSDEPSLLQLGLDLDSLKLAGLDLNMSRPYINAVNRDLITRGLEMALARTNFLSSKEKELLTKSPIHVNFCPEEASELLQLLHPKSRKPVSEPMPMIVSTMTGKESKIPDLVVEITRKLTKPGPGVARQLLRKRGPSAIAAFLQDAATGMLDSQAQIVRIQNKKVAKHPPRSSITALLRERETDGRASRRVGRGLRSFKAVVRNELEDSLALQDRWTDCCGDIFSLSWTSEDVFICGATAHSDFHNMQYNKPGNMSVGSASQGTLRAIADHRIVRPVVGHTENAENALESMRRTQDPWLYTSVVSTAHSAKTGYSFSASFDKTVKVWSVENRGAGMALEGSWEHEAKVNFVVTSGYHRLVATSADVSNNAIRVYHLDEDDISNAPYDTYTGERADEQAQELRRRDNWAYFPATIQWGRAERVSHLLLVGYSPRSMSGDDNDIPEDKRNTGELCMWNTFDGTKIIISSARTQNVFEVIWHPTQPIFYAATSPCGTFEPETRTQIQVFAQNELGTFMLLKALDCPACDINELTVMPNSIVQTYVTASCTDGNTYVWDTAQGDRAIHVLGHGEPIETPMHDLPRDLADAGVKFAAWGKSSNRFYTGSSDGKLKVWNIKAPRGEAFLRTILSIPAGISVGVFSADFSKLVLGDSTGTVHLLSVDQTSEEADNMYSTKHATIKNQSSKHLPLQGRRPPKVIIQHSEPDPPEGYQAANAEETAIEMAKGFLDTQQLVLNPSRTIGVVQGPRYYETKFFRTECHEGNDASKPLLPEWQVKQQERRGVDKIESKFPCLPLMQSSSQLSHTRNLNLDFDLSRLSISDRKALEEEGVDLGFIDESKFDYERIRPHFSLFKSISKESKSKSYSFL